VVSFLGQVHELDFSGDAVRVREPWSLVSAQDRRSGWRPGGYQLSAIHEASGRLFVGMHRHGAEGSHKNPAAEIHVYDIDGRKRLRRVPGRNAIAMTVNQAEAPRLFAIDGVKGEVAVLDVDRMVWLRSAITGIGETPAKLETFR
jgi:methylamine dehydrogenase heavy chain